MPFNLMTGRSFVQPLPPIMIRLTPKFPFHGFDDVPRVRVYAHPTRFLEGLEPKRRRGNFSLLIGRASQIGSERAPQSFETEQRYGSRTRDIAAVTET